MIKTSTQVFSPTITSYKYHQVRAFSQFEKLKSKVKISRLKKCGLWFDHKQKIIPMGFCEGQIEYFGKRGMSLLGFMLVIRGIKGFDGKTKEGITYYFYDVVMDKYSSQGSV